MPGVPGAIGRPPGPAPGPAPDTGILRGGMLGGGWPCPGPPPWLLATLLLICAGNCWWGAVLGPALAMCSDMVTTRGTTRTSTLPEIQLFGFGDFLE